jgi:hypothetical protein
MPRRGPEADEHVLPPHGVSFPRETPPLPPPGGREGVCGREGIQAHSTRGVSFPRGTPPLPSYGNGFFHPSPPLRWGLLPPGGPAPPYVSMAIRLFSLHPPRCDGASFPREAPPLLLCVVNGVLLQKRAAWRAGSEMNFWESEKNEGAYYSPSGGGDI